jgi:cell division protein FtsB
MKFLHYILALPFILFAAWAIYCAESADGVAFVLWPEDKMNISWNIRPVLLVVLLYGYIGGRVGSWFAQAPLRRELRQQKKTNKALTKEQNELNKTVSGLKQNVSDLQEKAKVAAISAPNKDTGIMAQIKNKFGAKKGI